MVYTAFWGIICHQSHLLGEPLQQPLIFWISQHTHQTWERNCSTNGLLRLKHQLWRSSTYPSLTPRTFPPRNKGLIACLNKGNQWSISPYWDLISGGGTLGGVGWPVMNQTQWSISFNIPSSKKHVSLTNVLGNFTVLLRSSIDFARVFVSHVW